jgi:hypothetical protein
MHQQSAAIRALIDTFGDPPAGGYRAGVRVEGRAGVGRVLIPGPENVSYGGYSIICADYGHVTATADED